jgi:glycosyltransferase involved in cell wall biosynthesis
LETPSDRALVSIIIPCYNQGHFLGEAVESVLAQNHPRCEIVVIDDGSTDNTSEVAARYPEVQYTWQENRGLAKARNSGLWHSQGEYLVFLDADDRLLSNALAVGLWHLEAHPELAFVSGRCRWIASDGSPLSVPPQLTPAGKDMYGSMLRGNYIMAPTTAMYRRAVFGSIGGFDASFPATADYDLYLRATRKFSTYHHGEIVAEYRRHDTNMTSNPALMLKFSVAVLRRQWPYARGNRHYREDYKAGMKFCHRLWGLPLGQKVLTHARNGEWSQAIQELLVLLRYPRVFVYACEYAWQKLRLAVLGKG